ncbi:hypothetical protein CBR_g30824 [Chara braunii]|uniref:HAT C-terminal dimerisation domain-containing protein n=1 Tax=Chara braunii TaxID=69332 RepID=A0A388JXI5_CHABU|nr:hypothetical protein CBR_g30824 [Chara braunii]|eukprot:GBG62506.1 hypothetical protein CBR_g30824 [Chara braunii]
MASSSGAGTSRGKEVAGSDDEATRVKEPFQPQPEARQLQLQATKVAFRWVTQGQMIPSLAKGQYKVKCNLCGADWVASYMRVWPHFTQKTNPRPSHYPELLHILAAKGHAIECKKKLRFIQLYRMEQNSPLDGLVPAIPEVEAQGNIVDAFIMSPTARHSRTVSTVEVDEEAREGVVEEGGGMLRTYAQGSVAGKKCGNLTQTSIKKWATNGSQQRLDVAWGMHLQAGAARLVPRVGGEKTAGKVVEESLWTDFAKFDSTLAQMSASELWNRHGASHKKLQDIAMRVTTMWSTATPCERNWSSLDLVHDKRRGPLSPDSLAKLVYIHLNLQLLDIKKKKSIGSLAGYLDMWAAFFNDVEAPTSNDPAVQDANGCGCEEEDIEESEEDDENFTLWSPRANDISNDDNELDDDLTRNVERGYLDSDLEFLRPRGMDFNACVEVDKDFDDDADRARAQSLAHRDRALVEGVQHDNLDVSLAGRKNKVQPDTGPKVARKRGRPRKYPLQPVVSACAPVGDDGGDEGEVEEHVTRGRKVQGGPALTMDGAETRLLKWLKRKAARKVRAVEDDPTDTEESNNESDKDGRESDWEKGSAGEDRTLALV